MVFLRTISGKRRIKRSNQFQGKEREALYWCLTTTSSHRNNETRQHCRKTIWIKYVIHNWSVFWFWKLSAWGLNKTEYWEGFSHKPFWELAHNYFTSHLYPPPLDKSTTAKRGHRECRQQTLNKAHFCSAQSLWICSSCDEVVIALLRTHDKSCARK